MTKLKASDTPKPSNLDVLEKGDIVSARVGSIEHRTFNFQGDNVDKLGWRFIFDDPLAGQWNGKEIIGDTSIVFTAHPNCKAYNWVAAITGREYKSGEELDTDDLIGMPCRVVIDHRVDRAGTVWMRVRDVMPARSPSKAAAPVDNPF